MATKDKQDQQEDFTPEKRVAYFEWKLEYWTGKEKRLLAAKKKAHAKKRIEHYTAKLAEAKEALPS